jgi:PAS domain S-box-containing protein
VKYFERKRDIRIKQSLAVFFVFGMFLVYIAYINALPVQPFKPYTNIYIALMFAALVIIGYMCWFVIFNLKGPLKEKPSMSNYITVFGLFTALCLIIYMTGAYQSNAKILALIPPVMMAVRFGKRFGMITAVLCCMPLIINDMTYKNRIYNPYFEKDLLLISIILMLSWLIGELSDTEKTIRKEIEMLHSKLFKQHRFLLKIMETSFTGILLLDNNLNIKLINPAVIKILQIKNEHCLGLPVKEVVSDPEFINIIQLALNSKTPLRNHEIKINLDGYQKTLFINMKSLIIKTKKFIIVGITDITALKDQELLIMQHEKLAAVAQTAAGFAHELKNPLTTIKGFTQLLYRKKSIQTDDMNHLKIMLNEANRADRLIEDFLNFATPKAPDKKLSDINEVIKSAIAANKTGFDGSHISVKTRFAKKLPLIAIDANQIQQAFSNIIKNSIEAMENTEETLFISSLLLIDNEGRQWIKVKICDRGSGISPDVLKDIVTPFFTTKDSAAGLGLYIAYTIIDQHDGEIAVKTRKGKGSSFYITLPVQ